MNQSVITPELPIGLLDRCCEPPIVVVRFASTDAAHRYHRYLCHQDSDNHTRYRLVKVLPQKKKRH